MFSLSFAERLARAGAPETCRPAANKPAAEVCWRNRRRDVGRDMSQSRRGVGQERRSSQESETSLPQMFASGGIEVKRRSFGRTHPVPPGTRNTRATPTTPNPACARGRFGCNGCNGACSEIDFPPRVFCDLYSIRASVAAVETAAAVQGRTAVSGIFSPATVREGSTD